MIESWLSRAQVVRDRIRIRSLRLRIQLWHASILAAVVLLFATIVFLQREAAIVESIDEELSAAVEVIHAKLQAADFAVLDSIKQNSETQTDSKISSADAAGIYSGGIVDERVQRLLAELTIPETFRQRRYRYAEDSPFLLVMMDSVVLRQLGVIPIRGGISRVRTGRGAVVRIYNQESFRVALGKTASGISIRIGRNIAPDIKQLTQLAWLLAVGGLAVSIIGLAGGWWLSERTVQPIKRLSDAASDISEHNMKTKINLGETDLEFKQLAETLNSTFARLDAAFSRQKDFTADASHELRTPLAILQMHQELALSKGRSAEEYVETLQICMRSANRMHHMIQSLLDLARSDEGHNRTAFVRVDLAQVVNDASDQLQALAKRRSIQLAVTIVSGVVLGRTDQIQQVLINLVENAIAYSEPHQTVVVRVIDGGDVVVLQVQDEGTGIPESDLPLVFDRFFRVDKQRSRDTGGSGLGLAICQSIVVAHHGSISVESTLNQGATFTVKIPKLILTESDSCET